MQPWLDQRHAAIRMRFTRPACQMQRFLAGHWQCANPSISSSVDFQSWNNHFGRPNPTAHHLALSLLWNLIGSDHSPAVLTQAPGVGAISTTRQTGPACFNIQIQTNCLNCTEAA